MKPIIKSLVPTNYWFPVLLTEDKFKYGGMLPIKMVSLRSTSPAATGTGYCDASGNSTHPDFLKFLTLSGTSVNPGKSTVNYAFMKNNFAGITASDVFYASAVSATVPAGIVRNAVLAKDGETTEYRNVSSFNGKSWKLRSDAPVLGYEKNVVSPENFEGYKNSIVSRGVTNNPEEHLGIQGGETCLVNIQCKVRPTIMLDDQLICETGYGEASLLVEVSKTLTCMEVFPSECCKDINQVKIDETAGLPATTTTHVNSDGGLIITQTAIQENRCNTQIATHTLNIAPPEITYHNLRVIKEVNWTKNNAAQMIILPGETCCSEWVNRTYLGRVQINARYNNGQLLGNTSANLEVFIGEQTYPAFIDVNLASAIAGVSSVMTSIPYDLYCSQQMSLGNAMGARKQIFEMAKNIVQYLDSLFNFDCDPPISGCCNIPSCGSQSGQGVPAPRPPRRQGSVGQQGP
jgi:hypothetical protein